MGSAAWAQTKTAPRKSPAAPKKAAPAAYDSALLQPATLKAKAPGTYEVKFVTTKGDFTVKVTRAWSPLGADRFYNLVKHGFFDGASLFRVVPGFVVQFGLSAYPKVSTAWQNAVIKDDPVQDHNTKGRITYAMGGKDTRTTQVFINLGNNSRLDSMGFSPFGEVSDGMDVVEQLYGGYGEATTSKQGEISQGGKAYLEKNFPKLDTIKSATLVATGAPEAPPPAKAPAKTGAAPAKKAPAKKAAVPAKKTP
ncbi:MAG: peptidylprolyl isomerase [Acidobacteria bacterium]|nr:peptidylprolyl isomerase [Acidobacteriota bacterium]